MARLLNRMTDTCKCFTVFLIALVGSVVLYYNNDYMRYRDIPVTFIEKSVEDTCHKTRCRKTYIGLFKTDGEIYFDRPISYYMYTQTPLREQFELSLRPKDIRQSPRENLLYFFLPVLLFSLAVVSGGMTLIEFFKGRSKPK